MRVILLVSFYFAKIACFADQNRLEGEPFQPPANVSIVWKAADSNLPTCLWVYRVCPQTFALPVVTNLLAISELKMMNRIARPDSHLLSYDTNFMRFMVKNKRGRILHCLDIAPTLGWITYHDTSGNGNDPLEKAPAVEEIKQLTFKCIFQAGIDRSLIDSKPRSMSVTTTERGLSPEIVTERGIFYSRKIDGIDERGFCFAANFGSHNDKPKLLSFEINWRNLVPYKPFSVATTNQMIDFIKSGRATLPPQPVGLENLGNAKQLTITQFTPIYFNKPGMDKVNFEYPYSEMTVVADFGGTNKATFYLNCPIIDYTN